MLDYKIHLKDFSLKAHIGILPEEKLSEQEIIIDLTLSCILPKKIIADNITDYAMVRDRIIKICATRHYDWLEELVSIIADDCLAIPSVKHVAVMIKKPDIFNGNPIPAVSLARGKKLN